LRQYDFIKKKDLLGAFGHVAPDAEDPSKEHIVTLGFIINDCPGRDYLKHERDLLLKKNIIYDLEVDVEVAVKTTTFEIIFFGLMIVVSFFILIYICLKNYGKFCRKSRHSLPLDDPSLSESDLQSRNIDLSVI